MQDPEDKNTPAGEQPTFNSKQAKVLADYWYTLADANNSIPSRMAFDPLAIPTTLPTVFLIEWLEGQTYKVRLQGTAFTERGAVDLTGLSLAPKDSPTAPESPLYALLDRILTTPCGLHVVGVEQSESGRQTLVEFTAFPLTGNDGRPRFVVGTAIPLSTLGYTESTQRGAPLVEVRELREIKIRQGNGEPA